MKYTATFDAIALLGILLAYSTFGATFEETIVAFVALATFALLQIENNMESDE